MSDEPTNVVPLAPVGAKDPAILRAIVLASQRLIRAHAAEFKKYLRDELRRTGGGPEGGAA